MLLYDQRAGGSGVTTQLYRFIIPALEAALELLAECDSCSYKAAGYDGGCPACLQSVPCDNFHQDSEQSIILARSRHIYALNNIRQSVTKALINKESSELLAEELTQAQHELSAITGEFTNDDLLGKIFSSFCIGK